MAKSIFNNNNKTDIETRFLHPPYENLCNPFFWHWISLTSVFLDEWHQGALEGLQKTRDDQKEMNLINFLIRTFW